MVAAGGQQSAGDDQPQGGELHFPFGDVTSVWLEPGTVAGVHLELKLRRFEFGMM